eukprot:1193781-Prorocentrum_minimum.AAC.2
MPMRALSLMSTRRSPVAMVLVPPRGGGCDPGGLLGGEGGDEKGAEAPAQCMVLRAAGELTLLDLEDASERHLADRVENFWLTTPTPTVRGPNV